MVVLGIIVGAGSNSTKIEGDTAKAAFNADAIQTPLIAGGDLAFLVWDIAKQYPDIRTIQVEVSLINETPIDSYGKPLPSPYIMGSVTVTDLTEIRKHERNMYWSNYREAYADQIRNMKYRNLFRGKDN